MRQLFRESVPFTSPLTTAAAGVQMAEVPPPTHIPEYDLEEEGDPDVRLSQYARDHCVVRSSWQC